MNTQTRPRTGQYSIAGVVVRSRAADVPRVTARLSGLPGVDVHHIEASTGRIVITLETDGGDQDDQDEARLEGVRREPGVLGAELVYHYVEPLVTRVARPGRPGAGAV